MTCPIEHFANRAEKERNRLKAQVRQNELSRLIRIMTGMVLIGVLIWIAARAWEHM